MTDANSHATVHAGQWMHDGSIALGAEELVEAFCNDLPEALCTTCDSGGAVFIDPATGSWHVALVHQDECPFVRDMHAVADLDQHAAELHDKEAGQ